MKRVVVPLGILLVVAFAWTVYALDPPHDATNSIDCSACHTVHKAEGGAITKVAGNANLCQTCHRIGGLASAKPFVETDQAFPSLGLPAGMAGTGTSHRWDSGPAGHVKADATNTSTGKVQSGGAFTGRYAKTYTITITAAGDAGTAIFSWTDTLGGGASGLIAGSGVPLDQGVNVAFTNGASSPSFLVNDRWKIYVRTDISQPANIDMLNRMPDGKIMCSTCHNQHSQAKEPFDSSAPAYAGSGTGAGRHFQRLDNSVNEMCRDCHSARNVTLSSNGSHPVGVTIPGTGLFKSPTTLPLDKTTGTVQCMSCHQPHYAPTSDGSLTRLTNITSLCTDCHTLADTASGSHFNTSTGVLWPGGQYGSNFPAVTDTSKRGACINCHQPHGWPDSGNPSLDYTKLLVENGSGNLCFTCHDADGPSTIDVYTLFNGTTNYRTTALDGALVNQRHDVTAADQAYSGGVVACANCHNPHRVTSTARLMDPDNTSVAFTQTYAKTNSYTRSGYNFSYQSASTDLDPLNPQACKTSTTGKWGIGWPGIPTPNSGNDTAVSGGTYNDNGDPLEIAYTVTVTTGGAFGTAQITVTSTGNRDNSGPTTVAANHTPVNVGTRGATITFHDPSVKSAALTLSDKWTVTVSPCATAPVLDMVTFCLTCHDNSPPTGVTMSPNLVNIASAYNSSDQHGRIAGNNGANGYMKSPWNDSDASAEIAFPYAALTCTTCHDGHGSDNIFHLKKSITVRGIQMRVGGGVGSGFEPPAFSKWGSATYVLPCFSGTTMVDCSTQGSSQQDHKWGAFCSFCHTMETHGQAEDNTCRTGHRHGGGAF